jgi:hypothetical protein
MLNIEQKPHFTGEGWIWEHLCVMIYEQLQYHVQLEPCVHFQDCHHLGAYSTEFSQP